MRQVCKVEADFNAFSAFLSPQSLLRLCLDLHGAMVNSSEVGDPIDNVICLIAMFIAICLQISSSGHENQGENNCSERPDLSHSI